MSQQMFRVFESLIYFGPVFKDHYSAQLRKLESDKTAWHTVTVFREQRGAGPLRAICLWEGLKDQTAHHQAKWPSQGLTSLTGRKFYRLTDHNPSSC